ncbi:hypothetical protein [Achromobacter sp. AGC39]
MAMNNPPARATLTAALIERGGNGKQDDGKLAQKDATPTQSPRAGRIDTPDQPSTRDIWVGDHHDLRHMDRLRAMLDMAAMMLTDSRPQTGAVHARIERTARTKSGRT